MFTENRAHREVRRVKGDRKYADFLLDVGRTPSLVYVFTGNDEFLKREALRKLTEALVPAEAMQFNCESFLGADSAWNDVEAACLSAPLFAARRVVALIGIELFGQADIAGLLAYARRPSKSTCFVAMTAGPAEEGKRRGAGALGRIVTAAGAPGAGVAAYALWSRSVRDCRAWARDWLRGRGKRMSEGLLQQVSETCGNSAYEVWNVMEKASAFAGQRVEITKEDVASIGGAASVGTAEEFRRAVACGDALAAHIAAARCLEAGNQPTLLLWFLNRAFRHALRGSGGAAEPVGGRPEGCEGKVKAKAKAKGELRWPEKRDVEALERRFEGEGLCRAISLLYETEKGIKSGALGPKLGLETLINELTGHRIVGYREWSEE